MARRKNTGSGKSKESSEGKFGRDGDGAKRIDILTISLSLTRALFGKTYPEARRQRSSLQHHGEEGEAEMDGTEISSTLEKSLSKHISQYLMVQGGQSCNI